MRPEDTQRCVPDPDWETPQQQFDIALAKKQDEIDELKDKAIQAIGWAYADCCAELDSGGDPRTMEMTDVLARAIVDLELKHKGE